MHLTSRLVIISTFIASTCFARIAIKSFQPDESRLIEAGVQILESCYGNKVISLGLIGNLTETISQMLWSRGSFSIISIDARIVDYDPVPRHFRYKLPVFLVLISSSTNVTKTFKEIKASSWWNHMAAFFILSWPVSNYGCSNAFDILWAAWEMNILNANLMCYHRTHGRMIYTFNPYTSQAPGLWQLDKIYKGKNDHPWSLFVWEYRESEEICNELNFEKANDLGGYEVRISVTNETFGQDRSNSVKDCIGLFEDIYCKILPTALNATPKMLIHGSLNALGLVDKNGKPLAILGEVDSGFSDIAFTLRFLSSMPNITGAYPHYTGELTCMTHYSGYKSQLSKILSVIDGKSRFGLCCVCLITVFIFKYLIQLPSIESFLNTLRLICNASLPIIPTKLAPRIYLGSLFVFALTMQGIYQGQLASLLTNQEALRNVNSMEDLIELDHTIYSSKVYRMYFIDLEVEGRYVEVDNVECSGYVLHDRKAACVASKVFIMYAAAKYKLHLARNSLSSLHMALPIRPDWPLEERVNTILRRSTETHVIHHIYDTLIHKTSRHIASQENEMYDQSSKVLTLDQLSFAFIILGAGLVCSAISFSIEVTLGRACSR